MRSLVRKIFVDRTSADWRTSQRLIHWLTVILCLSQIPTSWAIDRSHVAHVFNLPQKPLDLFLHQVHIWSGISIALLGLTRLVLRLIHGAPDHAGSQAPFTRFASTATHFALYALLGLTPVAGFLAAYVDGRFGPWHVRLNWTLLAVVVLHVAAALWHHLVLKDNVLARMIAQAKR